MRSKIFQYPKKIYNESTVLNIYKNQFPEIVKEYEKVVKNSYLNPKKFRAIVKEKLKIFNENFEILLKKYQRIEKNFENLIRIAIEMHRNYAFNFWLISYAICDGPLTFHYLKEMKKILKKLFPQREKYREAESLLTRTDYEIFYHALMRASVEIYDFLFQFQEYRKFLLRAKKTKSRKEIWDKLLESLNKNKKTKAFLKTFYKKWGEGLNLKDKLLFYTIMDEATENYETNREKVEELNRVRNKIQNILKLAKKKLSRKEAKKLKNLYSLIKAMLWAKDSVFGKEDIKMFTFWFPLTEKIISQFQKIYKIKISPRDSNFLSIPWSLRKYKKEVNLLFTS